MKRGTRPDSPRVAAPVLALTLALALAACGDDHGRMRPAGEVRLPPSDDDILSIEAGASVAEILAAVDIGLETREKGPDATRFVIVRSLDRHEPEITDDQFTVLVGAGVRMPEGSMRVRRKWISSGRIDGVNEQLQNFGIAIGVERGAPRPFTPEVVTAVSRFCEALAVRLPLHPDCVVAMNEVPYTNPHPVDRDERELAAAARRHVPVPPTDAKAVITKADGTRIGISYETRDTPAGIAVGMMMRKRFDGKNRGMLFRYPYRDYRRFWMRNCFIEIDVAYIREGVIEQIETMPPQAGTRPSAIPWHPSQAAVKLALEMPGGWFERNGVQKGDAVELQ